MTFAITAKTIFTGEACLLDMAVIVKNDIVADIIPTSSLPSDMPCKSYPDGFLAPGFIDTQVNGGGDVLFNDDITVNGITAIANAHRQFGTTGLLPTLITDSADHMKAAICAVNDAIQQGIPGVLGIHLEGPFLNSQRKGVHNPEKMRVISSEDIDMITSLPQGKTLMTLAPEIVGNDIIRQLQQHNIIVAAGHTAANHDQIQSALKAGLQGFTHLFNAMTPLHSREPGVVGTALSDPDSWCGVIADGHHVHYSNLKLAVSAKPQGKIILVTDAMPIVGSSKNYFTLEDKTIHCRNGRCETSDGVLAGSNLTMAQAVNNTVNQLNISLDEALRMASTYPATFLGLNDQLGYIKPGYKASFVLMDFHLTVCNTWINGQESIPPNH
jgi:N-acetylglucosamine-6-phosphate deacetylase